MICDNLALQPLVKEAASVGPAGRYNMAYWDVVLTGVIVVVAVLYLYRVFIVKKGCSCGSSSCSSTRTKNAGENNQAKKSSLEIAEQKET
jgi:hypothetical protein